MNQDARRSLERFLKQIDRTSRRPVRRRISTAPVVLAAGLVLGDQVLTRLVPVLWESLLPGGLEQANTLRGWPGLLWHLAVFCHAHPHQVWFVIGAVVVLSLFVSFFVTPLRFLVWLSAVAVIVADAGLLVIALRTSMSATMAGAGL